MRIETGTGIYCALYFELVGVPGSRKNRKIFKINCEKLLFFHHKICKRVCGEMRWMQWNYVSSSLEQVVTYKNSPQFTTKVCKFTAILSGEITYFSGELWWIFVRSPLALAVNLHNFNAFTAFHRKIFYKFCGEKKQFFVAYLT